MGVVLHRWHCRMTLAIAIGIAEMQSIAAIVHPLAIFGEKQ